jgi:hypothetical protein
MIPFSTGSATYLGFYVLFVRYTTLSKIFNLLRNSVTC